ncbi:hypothetical protein BH18CHL2_BH18CHL2_10040 [soil metagenome]
MLAVAAGVFIAFIDSRPTWDDTGVTAGLAIIAAAGSLALSGRRPWLWALLVGLWTPLYEIVMTQQYASLAVLLVAAVGAAIGYAIANARGPAPGGA